jgi:hypothetical protein
VVSRDVSRRGGWSDVDWLVVNRSSAAVISLLLFNFTSLPVPVQLESRLSYDISCRRDLDLHMLVVAAYHIHFGTFAPSCYVLITTYLIILAANSPRLPWPRCYHLLMTSLPPLSLPMHFLTHTYTKDTHFQSHIQSLPFHYFSPSLSICCVFLHTLPASRTLLSAAGLEQPS